ncbi:integrase [Actinokineospora bangkokensis]|uniref:Integrase n=1 Tax=Actinokineospora bangkokensis TaxID=1193682 RepID=A0A1Q9LC71_9PSEU|nr:integrase [Actinokineospora bangkokensis]
MELAKPPLVDLTLARQVIARLGITAQDLLLAEDTEAAVPTIAEFIPVVSAAVSPNTRKVYVYYWRKIEERWGDRRLDQLLPSEIKEFSYELRTKVVQRRNARGGLSTSEHLIGALRCLYHHAVLDGVIPQRHNPAIRVNKPRRQPNDRRALSAGMLAVIRSVASESGNDPELDLLIIDLHWETAARRQGGTNLQVDELDPENCVVGLREKAGSFRWQPVSPSLMRRLVKHVESRPGITNKVLRYRDGRPITYRRYDYIWRRMAQQVPAVANEHISTHWLRYTTLTWVERRFGFGVARAFAGHQTPRPFDSSVTTTYIRAGLDEVAVALAAMTGEGHPLTSTDGRPG